ncbi:hypothetical protein [Pantoea phage LIMEzero]|uniref:Uncharacterized protein n=1 Tax=Pantoea phage LIMEzero TaxID=943335 RepID=F4N9V5_9CAUD|nr:hypothetical protein LIMEzero_ORF52 [Pantoea phage LIMEzero]CBY88583.1 hypothetical protein [Pantoea phage LIMEzero]
MALSASTAAERKELMEAANNVLKVCKDFDNSGFIDTANTDLMTLYTAAITRLSAAITAATN